MNDKQNLDLHTLHLRAAQYYDAISIHESLWNSLDDLQFKLFEFEHRIKADDYDNAADLIDRIDENFLYRWGHSRRSILEMRQSLVGRISDRKKECRNLRRIGLLFRFLAESEQSVRYLKMALQIAREVNDLDTIAICLGEMGYAYRNLGHFRLAREAFGEAISLADQLGLNRAVGKYKGGLGILLWDLGEHAKALELHEEGIKIAQLADDKEVESFRTSAIGLVYADLGDFERATSYQEKALKLGSDAGLERNLGDSLSRLCAISVAQGQFEEALDLGRQTLALAQRLGLRRIESYCLARLAKMYWLQRDYRRALEMITFSLEISRATNNLSDRQWASVIAAMCFLSLGELQAALEVSTASCEIDLPTNNHRAYLINGIVNLYVGNIKLARSSFEQAISAAEHLLSLTASYFDAKYTIALAFAGLTAGANDIPNAEASRKNAVSSLHSAIKNCDAKGVQIEMKSLLDLLRAKIESELFVLLTNCFQKAEPNDT